jgi:predicted house-cleaning noncanonical NTP pyrophosphatase (MazG superfamily)
VFVIGKKVSTQSYFMKKYYNKLVRDRIPEIIDNAGNTCETTRFNPEDYRQALKQKILEEAREIADAPPEELLTEIADLYEAIDALLAAHGRSREEAIALQERRRRERGGFEEQIQLVWVERHSPPG